MNYNTQMTVLLMIMVIGLGLLAMWAIWTQPLPEDTVCRQYHPSTGECIESKTVEEIVEDWRQNGDFGL